MEPVWKLMLTRTWIALPMGRTLLWACATEFHAGRYNKKQDGFIYTYIYTDRQTDRQTNRQPYRDPRAGAIEAQEQEP